VIFQYIFYLSFEVKRTLTKRLIDLDMKMEHKVKKARDATVFFLSQFEHVLDNFAANKGMVKKSKKNELLKY
jgi:hypothetical protein